MAGLPGSIQGMMPAGADELVRRMRDLERRVDELGPSVARSFQPVIDDLTALVANTVRGGQAGIWGTGFAVTGSQADVATTSIAVPDGFTTAAVFAAAHVLAANDQPTTDGYLYVAPRIAGVIPTLLAPTWVPRLSWGSAHSSYSTIVTGLTDGSSIGIAAMVSTAGATWAAQPGHRAGVDAIAIFYR
jgi:hypothetical protein